MVDKLNSPEDFQPTLPLEGERRPGEWRDLSELSKDELLGALAVARIAEDEAKEKLNQTAIAARRSGASWTEIGRAASITQQSAYQRWSQRGREKHREYTQRSRKRDESEQPN